MVRSVKIKTHKKLKRPLKITDKNDDFFPDQCEVAEMIKDLVIGVGYNYSDIAKCTCLSPSEIQRIAAGKRAPSFRVYHTLLHFYCKTFYGKDKISHAANFLKLKKYHPLAWLEEIFYSDDKTRS